MQKKTLAGVLIFLAVIVGLSFIIGSCGSGDDDNDDETTDDDTHDDTAVDDDTIPWDNDDDSNDDADDVDDDIVDDADDDIDDDSCDDDTDSNVCVCETGLTFLYVDCGWCCVENDAQEPVEDLQTAIEICEYGDMQAGIEASCGANCNSCDDAIDCIENWPYFSC